MTTELKPYEILAEIDRQLPAGRPTEYWNGCGSEIRDQAVIDAQRHGLDRTIRELTILAMRHPHDAEDLDDLRDILNEYRDQIANPDSIITDYPPQMDSLPTFGGDDIEDTVGIWSWNANSVLIQDVNGEWQIEPRAAV